jgi:polyisoprenoid-binding protein YceI
MKMVAPSALFFLLSSLSQAIEVPLDVNQSSLKFTGHAFMHDFNGEAKAFAGSAQIDSQKPVTVLSAKIDIQAAKMTTFEKARDRNMFNWLDVDANPGISFHLDRVKLLKGDPAHATTNHPAQFTVEGDFTLNKIRKPLEAQALGWREGEWLVVTGRTQINTADHALPEIRQLFLTVDKKVDIAFRLVFDLPPELQISTQN